MDKETIQLLKDVRDIKAFLPKAMISPHMKRFIENTLNSLSLIAFPIDLKEVLNKATSNEMLLYKDFLTDDEIYMFLEDEPKPL